MNIVEDEENLNAILTAYLVAEGYQVRSYTNGTEALGAVFEDTDLWVIDIMLPDINGFTVFNKIKEVNPDVHIFFISARNQDIDRVMGLEMGCDDYISKPFMARELIIRVNRILKGKPKEKDTVKIGKYKIHQSWHKVYMDDDEVDLSKKEYDLLLYLIRNTKIALSREQILKFVWDDAYFGTERVVDDTIRRIRKKMPGIKIETVHGHGYILEGVE